MLTIKMYVCRNVLVFYFLASLRLGGEAVTYSDHLLVVGDAAGMIDPMTGEGIHHAMEGAKIAAFFLDEAFDVGNFDKEVMAEYQNRWMFAFGTDFGWWVESQ